MSNELEDNGIVHAENESDNGDINRGTVEIQKGCFGEFHRRKGLEFKPLPLGYCGPYIPITPAVTS